ncbi:MAG: hypothetical protein KA712_17465 [Myxococcales bacterium]|nr:hypothetical protein [Myxococcales bacterium]
MGNPATGQDIEDTCTRCGDTWHVVMAKVGDRIAKVVCKLCGSQHNYRKGAQAAAAAREADGARGSLRRKTVRSAVPTIPVPPPFDPTRPPRPYSARDLYIPGERIVHPNFGEGIVANASSGKIDVVFPSGPRVLAVAKEIPNLSRHKPVANVPLSDRPPDET